MKNKLVLLPTPQRLRFDAGFFIMPPKITLGISDVRLYPLACQISQSVGAAGINIATPSVRDAITLNLADRMKPDVYQLRINPQGAQINAGSVQSAYYGWQTFLQILEQAENKKIPCLTIDDWPSIPTRGVYLDIARGRVPTLTALKRMVDILARYKVNQLSLYMQHTFLFRSHPDIGRGASPLTAVDILELDAYCREHFVDLVPSLASFGHMETVLKLPPYRRLAEDFGRGLKGYVTPDPTTRAWLAEWFRSQKFHGFTLAPANPAGYKFLDSLYAEFLPLFSSQHFNVCCDETVDLGYGQSYQLCQQKGKGRVYIDHLLKLHALCEKHGKRMMCWGDILRHYPDMASDLPRDITVLDWGYNPDYAFDVIHDYNKQGRDAYACPSTNSFGALFPRLSVAMANISSAAQAVVRHGGVGLLNTIWGDGGHFHQPDCEWHGLLCGAEQSWNPAADASNYDERFCRVFLRSPDRRLTSALNALDEITQLGAHGFWPQLFFAETNRRVPAYPRLGRVFTAGQWQRHTLNVTARMGLELVERLDKIRAEITRAGAVPGSDPDQVLPAWIYAVDTLRHAARKLAVLGPGGDNRTPTRRKLVEELSDLMTQHRKLWLANSRPSNMRFVQRKARRAARCILRNAPVFEFKAHIPRGYITKFLVSRPLPYAGKIRALACPSDPAAGQSTLRDYPTAFCQAPELAEAWKNKPILMYFHARIVCRSPMRLALGLGYDGPIKAWLDGKPVWCDPAGNRPAGIDKAIVPLDLNKGSHALCLALDSNKGLTTGCRARVWNRDESAGILPEFDV